MPREGCILMSLISYCVVCLEGEAPVAHLYKSLNDANLCVKAYADADGISAWVATIEPPLDTARTCDQWGVFDQTTRRLHMCPSYAVAYGVSATSPSHKARVAILIRQTQPINDGAPQFAPAPRSSSNPFPGNTSIGKNGAL